MTRTLTQIAGENAIGCNSSDIRHLCKAVNYLQTQLRVMKKHDEVMPDYIERVIQGSNEIIASED